MEIINTPPDLSASAAILWAWAVEFVPQIAGALLILILGVVAARWAGRMVVNVATRSGRVDPTARPVLGVTTRYAILILVIVATLGQLGVQTASLLAVLGAAGFAIGLALQGTLSNIAAGLMLLWLRPFRNGDYIETPTVSGLVREIGLFVTTLDTYDGLFRFVPNSEIWNRPLVNHNRNAARLVAVSFGIALDADSDRARALALEIFAGDSRVFRNPAPETFVESMTDNFVFLGVRAWVGSGDYWPTRRELAAALKRRVEAAGIPVARLLHPTPDIGTVESRPRRPAEAPAAAEGMEDG